MDIALVIRHRLRELGLDQRDLAAAAQVTESYISQLLAGKKTPPAPGRTGIYEKIGKFLKLPKGELSRLVELQRKEDLKKKVADVKGGIKVDHQGGGKGNQRGGAERRQGGGDSPPAGVFWF